MPEQQQKLKYGLSIVELDKMCRLYNKIIKTDLLPLVVVSKQDQYRVEV